LSLCPQCLRDDQVEKVSALTLASKARKEVPISAMTRARVMAALQPPIQPEADGDRLGYGMILGIMLLCVALALIVWGLVIHTPLTNGGSWTTEEERQVAGGLGVMVAMVGMFWFIIWRKDRNDTVRSVNYQTRLVRWKQEMLVWEQLQYCHRDSGVFLPGTTVLVRPEAMGSLLSGRALQTPQAAIAR
jgi:hypothetical protein